MKMNYEKPIVRIEELERADVLLISEQTDNRHISSDSLLRPNGNGFDLSDIL